MAYVCTVRLHLQLAPARAADTCACTCQVAPILRHLEIECRRAVIVGRGCAGDEMDEGFQGQSGGRAVKIKFKDEGDGFLVDAICVRGGYCFCFWWRHEPISAQRLPPAVNDKVKDLNLSPLHMRCVYLLWCLPYNWHSVWWDNYYNSVKFCVAAGRLKTHVSGVVRSGGRGFPEVAQIEEVKAEAAVQKVKGKVKVAILKGQSDAEDLVAVCVYDNKPVRFISTFAKVIEWVVKERRCWSNELKEKITISFLRLNINDEYNGNKKSGMGQVDTSDQLRNVYRLMSGMRKRKWWWAILMWAFGIGFTNVFLIRFWLTGCSDHYGFLKAIALAWILPEVYDPNYAAAKRARSHKRKAASEPDGTSTRSKTAKPHKCSYLSEKMIVMNEIKFRLVGDHEMASKVDAGIGNAACCALCKNRHVLNKIPITFPQYKLWKGSEQYCKDVKEYSAKKKGAKVMYCKGCSMCICQGCWADWHRPH